MTSRWIRGARKLAVALSLAALLPACGHGEYDAELDGMEEAAETYEQSLTAATIFAEGYASGWGSGWSWKSTVGTSSLAYSGSRAISWKPNSAWAGLYLHSNTGVNTGAYTYLTFALRAPKSGMKIGLSLYDSNNKACGAKVILPSPPGGAWQRFTIPLSSLNGTGRVIKGITFTEQSGAAQSTLYIDALRFVASDTTSAPPSTTTSTTSSGLALDERFDAPMTISYGVPGVHPTYFLEWNGLIAPKVFNGVLSVTGNSHTNSYRGYHRGFSKKRYGGVGKATIFRARVRMTKAYAELYNGTYAGIKLGMKFPRDASITGYSKDDPRSVVGNDKNSPGSMIVVMGIGPTGRLEVARNPAGPAGYLPFPSAKFIPYSAGTWKDVTIRVEQTPGPNLRVKIWHSAGHDMSKAPVYEFSGQGVSDDKGFIWFRNDFADFEYDYVKVEERSL